MSMNSPPSISGCQSTTVRHLKHNIMWTPGTSLRPVRWLWLWDILSISPLRTVAFHRQGNRLFSEWFPSRSGVSQSSSAKPHWLCPCPLFVGCNPDLPQPWTACYVDEQSSTKPWKPDRGTVGAGQVQGSRGPCNDSFVLLVFSLEWNQQICHRICTGERTVFGWNCLHNAITVISASEAVQKIKCLSFLKFLNKQNSRGFLK